MPRKPPSTADHGPLVLFVSSVQGHAVQRFGTHATPGGRAKLIGADRLDDGSIVWDTARVVGLTAYESAKYRREYARALREKALVPRTRADYEAHLAALKAKTAAAAAQDAAPPQE